MNKWIPRVLCGGMGLCLFLLGMTAWTFASDQSARLFIHAGRLTGQLTQVSLRSVLSQLRNQLHITYVAPEAELEKRISVTLEKELLPQALSKILAPWDYAFTLDAAGNIKILYVTAKVSPEASLAEAMIRDGKTDRSSRAIHESRKDRFLQDEHPVWPEDQYSQEGKLRGRSNQARKGRDGKLSVPMAVQREIRPPAPGASMPILPAKQKDMPIIPGSGSQTMEIIPPTAYPPMNIKPVQEHVKQEMLLRVKP